MSKKTYYEKKLEQYNNLLTVESRKDFLTNSVNFKKKIEKDSDSEICAALLKDRELIDLGILKTVDKEKKPEYTEDEARLIIGNLFEEIKLILKRYVKLREEYYDVIAVWIIGTYAMDSFSTYPYLFMNAQKGSGKTRLLKLLEVLVNKGVLLASMREAVLFRLADKGYALLIDELEGLDRKENAPLRELLNACYKRGTKVFRMKKVGDTWDFEAFTPFTPIAIANIGGVDNVLGDRVITLILEKSSNPKFALLQEDYAKLAIIEKLKRCGLCRLCSLCMKKYNIKSFNAYIDERNVDKSIYTNTTLNTLYTYNTPYTHKNTLSADVLSVYNRIVESKIGGRHLELMLPLLFIALILNEEVFEKVLEFGKNLSKEKKEEDITESLDVSLIDFVSKMKNDINYDRFRFVYKITDEFRYFMGIRDKQEQPDINPLWVGRALKRLGLIVDRRRVSAGMEVRLDIPKAVKLLEEIK